MLFKSWQFAFAFLQFFLQFSCHAREVVLYQYVQATDYAEFSELVITGRESSATIGTLLSTVAFMPADGDPAVVLEPVVDGQNVVSGLRIDVLGKGALPPVDSGLIATGWWRQVTSLGDIDVGNDRLFDPETKDGIFSRWWSRGSPFTSWADDINEHLLDLLKSIGLRQLPAESQAFKIDSAYTLNRIMTDSYTLKVENPQLIFQDWTRGGPAWNIDPTLLRKTNIFYMGSPPRTPIPALDFANSPPKPPPVAGGPPNKLPFGSPIKMNQRQLQNVGRTPMTPQALQESSTDPLVDNTDFLLVGHRKLWCLAMRLTIIHSATKDIFDARCGVEPAPHLTKQR